MVAFICRPGRTNTSMSVVTMAMTKRCRWMRWLSPLSLRLQQSGIWHRESVHRHLCPAVTLAERLCLGP